MSIIDAKPLLSSVWQVPFRIEIEAIFIAYTVEVHFAVQCGCSSPESMNEVAHDPIVARRGSCQQLRIEVDELVL